MIRITYDMQADALAIQLKETRRMSGITTKIITPGVHLDYDSKGRVTALEILDASHHLPRKTLEVLPSPVEYLTLKQAARESHLSTDTLRAQIRNGRITAVKRGRDWFIESTDLTNYLESRDARGRPARKQKARRKKTTAA